MRIAARMARTTAALSMIALLAAHIGSPQVFFAGSAGAYKVDVIVRPPQVVPGIAEVYVKLADTTVRDVIVRPVYWRAGSKGAPRGDAAQPVKGQPGAFVGQLWLMASGAYSVHVTVNGSAGGGTVVVPVASVATGQLGLSLGLKLLLGALGALLVAGVLTAVHAAVGESQVAPGEPVSDDVQRRARRAVIVALPLMLLVVLGAARWWTAEAAAYRRTLYRPIRTTTRVSDSAGIPRLTLTIADPAWRRASVTAIMPDHGKMSHMFIARVDSPFVFAHLHPDMPTSDAWTTPLPPLIAGRYRVFNDIVHESGFEQTLVDSFTLATPLSGLGIAALSADEAWSNDVRHSAGQFLAVSGHDGNFFVHWAGRKQVVANEPGVLRFVISDDNGKPVVVQPYLGMQGHAVVMRDDGKVFVHLHPSGTSSMASPLAFAMRDRGDTTSDGRLRLDTAPMTGMATSAPLHEISFPYAFPSAGRYRVWVQIRSDGKVHTSPFDVTVLHSLR